MNINQFRFLSDSNNNNYETKCNFGSIDPVVTHGDMSVPFNSCQLTGGCEVEKTDGMG